MHPCLLPALGRTQGAVCAFAEAGKAWIPPAEERTVFGDISRHFRPGAPVRKWHYDKVRYTQRRTSRPQSPATRVFSGMSAACTFTKKLIIQVHIEPKSRLVSRHSAVFTKLFLFSKEESNGKYKEDKREKIQDNDQQRLPCRWQEDQQSKNDHCS